MCVSPLKRCESALKSFLKYSSFRKKNFKFFAVVFVRNFPLLLRYMPSKRWLICGISIWTPRIAICTSSKVKKNKNLPSRRQSRRPKCSARAGNFFSYYVSTLNLIPDFMFSRFFFTILFGQVSHSWVLFRVLSFFVKIKKFYFSVEKIIPIYEINVSGIRRMGLMWV